MSGIYDLKTHMNKSSIGDLIEYIKNGDTPPSCTDIYTIARGIQYMDDTYLREYTTEKLRSMKPDKPKTSVPYNEWIKCTFNPIEETWHEPTTHMERENWSHDRKMRISDNNGLSCATKECRESKGLGSCLPKSRMLKDSLSTEENNDLIMLRTAIMENKIDELKKIIDDADSVEGAYKNLKKYVLDDANLDEWKTCILEYKNKKSCDNKCEIGKTPKICRPTSAKRISSKPVASYIQAYDQLANAISEKETLADLLPASTPKYDNTSKINIVRHELETKTPDEIIKKPPSTEVKSNSKVEIDHIIHVANGIQYMDDNYLRENNTIIGKKKTPLTIEQWKKCMLKSKSDACEDEEGCRKSKGVDLCLPERRKLKANLSDSRKKYFVQVYKAIGKCFNTLPTDNYRKMSTNCGNLITILSTDQQPGYNGGSGIGGGKTRKRKGRSSTKKHKKNKKYKKRASTKKYKKYKKNKKRPRTRKR